MSRTAGDGPSVLWVILVGTVAYLAVGYALRMRLTFGEIPVPSVSFAIWLWSAGLMHVLSLCAAIASLAILVLFHRLSALMIAQGRKLRPGYARGVSGALLITAYVLWWAAGAATVWISDRSLSIEGYVRARYPTPEEYQSISGESVLLSIVFLLPLAISLLLTSIWLGVEKPQVEGGKT